MTNATKWPLTHIDIILVTIVCLLRAKTKFITNIGGTVFVIWASVLPPRHLIDFFTKIILLIRTILDHNMILSIIVGPTVLATKLATGAIWAERLTLVSEVILATVVVVTILPERLATGAITITVVVVHG